MSLSLRQRFALFRWRLKARKKNCVGLRVGNAYESQHMLRVIYGAATDRMNAQFLAQVNALRSADAQRRAA